MTGGRCGVAALAGVVADDAGVEVQGRLDGVDQTALADAAVPGQNGDLPER